MAAADRSTPAAGAPAAVLVIDDDPTVRAIIGRILEREGYRVVEAYSGRNALTLLRDGAEAQLVVTDLKMSDGSGGWLVAQLAYEYPALLPRTVIVSGDPDGAKAAHVSTRWRCPVIPKPVVPEQLLAALRGVASRGEAEVA